MKRSEPTAQRGAGNQEPLKRVNPKPAAPKPKPAPDKVKAIDISKLPFKLAKIKSGIVAEDFVPFQTDSATALADARAFAAEDQKFIRYLTIGFGEQMKYKNEQIRAKTKIAMIDSMSVLINSLSTAPTIVKPAPLNEGMSLFRIDIRNYRWTAAQYDKVVKGTNLAKPKAYPYTVVGDENITQLKALLGTDVPVVRADWFLFEAGKPQNYHDLLAIEDTLQKIEQRTNVNRLENIKTSMNFPQNTPLAIRAGIGRGKSGVSTNNRVIERHKASFGSFWLSYDFAAPETDTARDIFASPLGPGETGNMGELKGFAPAGGELIFNLPNSLQAYALLDDKNKRIDVAPTAVVFNPTDRNRAGAITNGFSCWSCHSMGILAAKDELRPFAERLSGDEKDKIFGKKATDAILAMHIKQDKLDNVIAADSKVHNDAVAKARIVFNKPMAQKAWVAQYYEDNMSLAMVAAELDLSLAQLRLMIPSLSRELQSALQSAKTKDLDRVSFETLYGKLAKALFTKSSE